MPSLRLLLSTAHQRGLRRVSRLLDEEADDPLFAERMQRIHVQIVAAFALRSMLKEMGIATRNLLDLHDLVDTAASYRLLDRRQVGILKELNRQANEAKHNLVFPSRL